MVMKAKVVFLEFQKEGKNFFPVEPDGFLNKCVECGFCDRYKLTEFLNTKKIILTDQFAYGRPELEDGNYNYIDRAKLAPREGLLAAYDADIFLSIQDPELP